MDLNRNSSKSHFKRLKQTYLISFVKIKSSLVLLKSFETRLIIKRSVYTFSYLIFKGYFKKLFCWIYEFIILFLHANRQM